MSEKKWQPSKTYEERTKEKMHSQYKQNKIIYTLRMLPPTHSNHSPTQNAINRKRTDEDKRHVRGG